LIKKIQKISCTTCTSRDSGVFCSLHEQALNKLDEEKNINIYKKGQNLFIEGNPPFGLFCIHNGKVKITKTGRSGKETIIRIASNGDLLGHRSLFSSCPYTASATITEEATICFISKKTILKLIEENPTFSLEILKRIGIQMGAAEERIASLSQKSIRERFAELLLTLKASYGKEMDDGEIQINAKLTREEMASIIGAAPENLIRLVTEFKNNSLIRQEGKYIYLINISKIEEIASLDY